MDQITKEEHAARLSEVRAEYDVKIGQLLEQLRGEHATELARAASEHESELVGLRQHLTATSLKLAEEEIRAGAAEREGAVLRTENRELRARDTVGAMGERDVAHAARDRWEARCKGALEALEAETPDVGGALEALRAQ